MRFIGPVEVTGDRYWAARCPAVILPEPTIQRSVDNSATFGLQPGETVLHLLDLLRRMALPFRYFGDDAQRIPGAVGHGRIAGEFLVSQIGVIRNRAGGFHL